MKTLEWIEKKLVVGIFPFIPIKDRKGVILVNDKMEEYDYVINMSDEHYTPVELKLRNARTFWFPMNEKKRDIGLNSIYGAMVILYQAEMENRKVYLHCHSGRNRSVLTKACYYYMRTGQQIIDPSKDSEGKEDGKYLNRLHRACTRGYLPPMAEMEEFLRNIAGKLGVMNGGNLDKCKKTINNF
jgi:hypothetical protein